MADYSYKAITSSGDVTKGKIEANDKDVALMKIKDLGMFPVEVKEDSVLSKDIVIGKPFKSKDLMIFCNQFEIILKAGVPVLEALYMLKSQSNKKFFKGVIGDIYTKVEQGEQLSDAMGNYPDVFPSILINMVRAGEATGNLEVSFNRMTIHFEKEYKLKQDVKKASIYPIIVGIVATAVVVILLTLVVPVFVNMFNEMGTELPAVTRALIAISNFLTTRWYIVLALVAVIVIAIMMLKKVDSAVMYFSKLKLKIPAVGILTKNIASARFARTTSTLLASGLSIIDTMDIVSDVVGNTYVRDGLIKTKDQISEGAPLSEPLDRMKTFPPMIVQMVRIGEETGELEALLDNMADFYETEVENSVKQLTTIMEPAIIVILAIIVGFIVLSIVMPMFQMYSMLGDL